MELCPKILIVDDRPENLFALHSILKVLRVEIIQAPSGNDALALANEHDFALIYLDIDMPGMDGYEVARHLKSYDKTMNIPILFLTSAYHDEFHSLIAYHAGGIDYIEKPICHEILLAKAKLFLELYINRKKVERTNIILQSEVLRRQATETAYRECESRHEAKRVFIAKMSHEFRTPMNSMIGMLDMLEGTPLSEEQFEYIDSMRQATDHLTSMVGNLLDITQLEAGIIKIKEKPFSLIALVKNVINIIRPLAFKKKILFIPYISPDIAPWFIGDANRLQQILVNLLGNAIKYTHWGSVALLISAKPVNSRYNVEFKVVDTGDGIDLENQEKIFQAFVRGAYNNAETTEGTGLGLSICKNLVDLMQGTIELKSTPQHGSTFSVSIPLTRYTAPVQTGKEKKLQGVNLSILTDHLVQGMLFEEQLTRHGAHSHLCFNGQSIAACFAEEKDTDLLIVHHDNTSKKKLLQGFEKFKQEVTDCKAKILICGRCYQRDDMEALADRGVSIFPDFHDEDELIDKIQSVLGLHKNRKKPDPLDAKKRVLIVDDSEDNRVLLSHYLRDYACEIIQAVDGHEAIDTYIASRHSLDLVLMDLQMPGLDGLSATQKIRAWEKAHRVAKVPIVIISAHATESHRDASLNAGSDAFLNKPIRKKTLKRIAAQFLLHAEP